MSCPGCGDTLYPSVPQIAHRLLPTCTGPLANTPPSLCSSLSPASPSLSQPLPASPPMCVAELCVTVLPCQHRWYHLVRPCSPSSNLSTCGKKLGISGWEVKCEYCPYCQGHVSEFEYRLIGDGPAPPVGSLSGLARAHSTSLNAARRDIRLDKVTRTDSATSVGSKSSLVTAASEKNRAMNSRLDAYFFPANGDPPVSPYPSAREDDVDASAASPSDTSSSADHSSVRHASMAEPYKVNMLSRVRRRTKRLSGIFSR